MKTSTPMGVFIRPETIREITLLGSIPMDLILPVNNGYIVRVGLLDKSPIPIKLKEEICQLTLPMPEFAGSERTTT